MLRKRFVSVNERHGSECILVAKAIASLLETLIGNGESLKCCELSGSTVLTGSTPKILETIDIEHSAGYIINSTCKSFHEEYGCGSTTLVCLIGYWASAFQDLVDMGVPTTVIVNTLDEISEEMENVLKRSRISLRNIQDVELDRPIFHHEMNNIILPRSPLNRPSQLPNNTSNNRVEANTLNHCERFTSCSKNLYTITENSMKSCFSAVRPNRSSCKSKEVEESSIPDEFDACFEGLSVNKDTSNCNAGEIKENPSDFPIEEKFEKNLNEICGSFFKLPDIYGKPSPHKNTKHETNVAKKIHKKTNVRDVFLRTRNLTDVSLLQSTTVHSQIIENDRKCVNVNTTLGETRSNSAVFKESYEYKQSSSTIKGPKSFDPDTGRNDKNWLDILGHGLAHGKEHEMSLALEILKKQYSSSGKLYDQFSFLLDSICVQTVMGPVVEKSCVLEGTVVELSKENHSIIACDPNTRRLIALVKGDISYNYRHTGFKESVRVTRTLNKDDFYDLSLNAENEWLVEVMSFIKRSNLGVIALHGQMDKGLRANLQTLGVIILENLSDCQLNVLSKMTETPIFSYILDFSEHDFAKQVVIKICADVRTEQPANGCAVQTPVFGQVCLWSVQETFTSAHSAVYSVLLCGPVQDLVNDSEQRFWNCAHRLYNTFEDQCVLPGGGNIEERCMKHLKSIRDLKQPAKTPPCLWVQEDYVLFRPLIIDAVCSGMNRFVRKVNVNIENIPSSHFPPNVDMKAAESSRTLFDNYGCKLNSWKGAIRIVKLFLTSEYHIITGI
ncbi:Bardet-Biedl syndrome 12 protein homolog [Dendronephthya gigantea]|uniref:Bardet-Biedl syndrome 12 protein homolog n=1 Tax=Dendronephthya gigantea TaxID=151771 RepID=UPI00106DADA0|nr:Bardet-Biedl syndrome 12 protein homolog [Dendronephthya gigantea]